MHLSNDLPWTQPERHEHAKLARAFEYHHHKGIQHRKADQDEQNIIKNLSRNPIQFNALLHLGQQLLPGPVALILLQQFINRLRQDCALSIVFQHQHKVVHLVVQIKSLLHTLDWCKQQAAVQFRLAGVKNPANTQSHSSYSAALARAQDNDVIA